MNFNCFLILKVKEANFSDLDEVLRKKYEKQLKDINLIYDYFYDSFLFYQGFFEIDISDYFAYGEVGMCRYDNKASTVFNCMFSPFDSPNSSYYDGYNPTYLGHKEKRKQVPSTLGKYYFQLSYQKEIYIELLQKYYPSMTNSPQGWNKKMMKRLEIYEMR